MEASGDKSREASLENMEAERAGRQKINPRRLGRGEHVRSHKEAAGCSRRTNAHLRLVMAVLPHARGGVQPQQLRERSRRARRLMTARAIFQGSRDSRRAISKAIRSMSR